MVRLSYREAPEDEILHRTSDFKLPAVHFPCMFSSLETNFFEEAQTIIVTVPSTVKKFHCNLELMTDALKKNMESQPSTHLWKIRKGGGRFFNDSFFFVCVCVC